MTPMKTVFTNITFLRKLAVAGGFTVVVVLLLLWLAGTFHKKIDAETAAVGGKAETPMGRSAVGVPTEVVRKIRLPATESAVGSIRAVHETSLASKLLAKVLEVNVKAGSPVRQGDVLVRLDDADLKSRQQQAAAAADNARAARDQAKTEFDRVQQLLDQGSASKVEFDRRDAELKSAEAELRRADQAQTETVTILAYATIRAPNAGIVIDKQVEAGDTVTPGQVLLRLYDPTRMQLIARVRESLTRRLTIGQTVSVRVEALGKTCQGQVSEIVPEAESASRTFSVKVTGPCPDGIYSGMFGRLLIPLDDEEVLVLSRTAVRRIGQLEVVEVVEGGLLRRRIVQLGRPLEAPHDGLVEILSGLREGEQVAFPAITQSGGAQAQ